MLLSHLHPDHTNGIRAADGSMAFPNAEIMVPAVDWEFWMSDENAAKAQSNEMMKNYFANVKKIFAGIESKVTKYDWGKEVAPGITSIATPGPYARAYLLRGRVRQFEDPDPVRRHQHPRVLPAQSGLARRLRRRPRVWRRRPATNSTTWRRPRRRRWSASTSPFPSIGHVEKDGNGYRLIPVAWNPVI